MSNPLNFTQRQARIGVFASAFILLAVYFFEYSGVNINQRGEFVEVAGTITHCGNNRVPEMQEASYQPIRYLFIDTTGDRAYRYKHPESFREQVARACRSRAKVKLTYRTYQPLLYDWIGYTLIGLHDAKTGEPYFSVNDYVAWQENNKLMADVMLGVVAVALIYLVLVWRGVLGNRDTAKVMQQIRVSRPDDEQLLIKSSERNSDAWAFLLLFTGMTIWFVLEVADGKSTVLLLAAVVTLVAAYAYLVEVVNITWFVLDAEGLFTFSKPLPWFNSPLMIPVIEIDYFLGEEIMVSSPLGDAVQYAVSVRLVEQPDELLLFYTRDLAEAESVAQLANEKLGAI